MTATVRWALLLAAAASLTLPAVWQASRLEVATGLVDLLPDDAPAAADYRTFLTTFGGFEKVYAMVLWRGDGLPDRALLGAAADLLASGLVGAPEVAGVRSGLTSDDEDFLRRQVLPRAPFFLGSDEELAARLAPEAVRARVGEIRERLRGPGGAVEAPWLAADPLGVSGGLEGLAAGGSSSLVDPLSGALLSADGDAALVVVTPAAGELDPAAGRALEVALDRAWAEMLAALGDPPLELAAVGGPLYAAQDERIVREDLAATLAGSGFVVVLLLVAFFGRLAIPLALLAAVAVGIVWTAGAIAVFTGEISVLGLSFAAMLLGLGVDYGIHGASRFRAGRLAALDRPRAMAAALAESGPAIVASMVSTAAAFLVLSLAHFRPVRELGLVMAGGILLILLASVSVAAPLLVLVPSLGARRRSGGAAPPPASGVLWRALGSLVAATTGLGRRRSGLVALGGLLATVVALAGAARLELSIDLRALRPADHPAFAAEELLVEGFGLGLDSSTVVVTGGDLSTALARARRVEAAVATTAGGEVTIDSPARWLPAGRIVERRSALLSGAPAAAAVAALEEEIVAQGLSRVPFAPALEVLHGAAAGEPPPPLDEGAWPDWVGELVRVDAAGAAVAVRLSTPLGSWPQGPPPEVMAAIEAAAPGAAVASVPRLGGELRRLILGDLGRLGGWALAAVGAVVVLSFAGRPRPLRSAAFALAPVVLGSVWTLGLAGFLGFPIDPFTVVVAPLLLGIGIDDGLHALQGERAFGSLVASLSGSGRAMTLTTLTTCAGFGGLAFSSVPSLANGGVLVASGAIFCLLATLLLLPALDRRLGRRPEEAPS